MKKTLSTIEKQMAAKELINKMIQKNLKGGAGNSGHSTCPPPCCH